MTGTIDRHGPHQAAEKSTTAGRGASTTKRSKSPSPTASKAVFSCSISLTPLDIRHRRCFPAAAERLVTQHDGSVEIALGCRDGVLGLQQRALGIEQAQEVERAFAILDASELGRSPRSRRLLDDGLEPLPMRAVRHERVLGLRSEEG